MDDKEAAIHYRLTQCTTILDKHRLVQKHIKTVPSEDKVQELANIINSGHFLIPKNMMAIANIINNSEFTLQQSAELCLILYEDQPEIDRFARNIFSRDEKKIADFKAEVERQKSMPPNEETHLVEAQKFIDELSLEEKPTKTSAAHLG